MKTVLTFAKTSFNIGIVIDENAKIIYGIFTKVKIERNVDMISEKKKKRYPNLEAEMARRNVLKSDLAELLHRTNGSITTRMDGTSEWLVWEIKAIKNFLKTDLSLEELFESEDVND